MPGLLSSFLQEWKVDYMKEDACGQCRPGGKIDDYKAMQAAIDATGSPLILTIEGQPPFPEVADGAHGNARRVGHDISPHWLSMTSLVDTGSGLWTYAHNDTGNGETTMQDCICFYVCIRFRCALLRHQDFCAPPPPARSGGWWNDLDMIEIGNGVFQAEQSSQALAMSQTHMTCVPQDFHGQ